MFFNSLSFVLLFLPITFAGYFFIVPPTWRLHFLLTMSLLFYALSSWAHLLLLIVDILWVFVITRTASYPHSRWRFAAAVSFPLLVLIFFKYLTFILTSVLAIPAALLQNTILANIVLPIGVSFFTFELISYAVDRYRNEVKKPVPPMNFALFVTFFPHLVAGPILRYRDVAGQFAALPSFRLTLDEARDAFVQICLGFFLKILLADWLSAYIVGLKDQLGELSAPGALFLIFGFSFQIYFDFFGYSLIAIGLGRLLGIRLPDNFRLPYESRNPREFWRRWHISLSYWLRDYLYFPLGGNKRYARNILIVFVVCGIWHGAGWNFAVWGLVHAFLVVGYHVFARSWDSMPILIQRSLTFVLVSFAWLPFLFDMQQIGKVLASLAIWSPQRSLPDEAWLALVAAAGFCLIADTDRILQWLAKGRAYQIGGGLIAGIVAITCLLFFDRTETFIYFRF